jgi:probable phosphoglycerate mutase
MTEPGRLFLVRHGATTWSQSGEHTGVTDLPLTTAGEAAAITLRWALEQQSFDQVLTSPMLRARRTAELAGFPSATADEDLVEWNYGEYEGITTFEIRKTVPGWTVWTHESPGGETARQVAKRLDRVIARARANEGDTLVFGHGHSLRALTARWLGQPASAGRMFRLDTATISVLGHERETPVVLRWNAPA